MSKKNKVFNLFDDNNSPQEANYSSLLVDLVMHFDKDFPVEYSLEEMLHYGRYAWNFANLSADVPPEEYEGILSSAFFDEIEKELVAKMVKWKLKEFDQHKRYIGDFEIEPVEENPRIDVSVVSKNEFLLQLLAETEDDLFEDEGDIDLELNYDEGYIDRFAIVIKPKKPFFDWVKKVDPEYYLEKDKSNVYLVNEVIEDLQAWLKVSYDDFFRMELEHEILEEENWPPKRTYNMFKKWFDVQFSTMVYDLEEYPVSKES